LGRTLSWPTQVDTPLAAQDAAEQGASMTAVAGQSSPWLMFQAQTPGGATVSLERGILQMQVDVTVPTGGVAVTKRITARRFMSLEPSPEGDRPRLVVQGVNIYRDFASL